jgi:hypothetical protein
MKRKLAIQMPPPLDATSVDFASVDFQRLVQTRVIKDDEEQVGTQDPPCLMSSISTKNAFVSLIRGGSPDNSNFGPPFYPETPMVVSDIRLTAMYAQNECANIRAPRRFARFLLMGLLKKMRGEGIVNDSSAIVLECDPSENGQLRKFYNDIGFEFLSRDEDEISGGPTDDGQDSYGGLMSAKVGEVIRATEQQTIFSAGVEDGRAGTPLGKQQRRENCIEEQEPHDRRSGSIGILPLPP